MLTPGRLRGSQDTDTAQTRLCSPKEGRAALGSASARLVGTAQSGAAGCAPSPFWRVLGLFQSPEGLGSEGLCFLLMGGAQRPSQGWEMRSETSARLRVTQGPLGAIWPFRAVNLIHSRLGLGSQVPDIAKVLLTEGWEEAACDLAGSKLISQRCFAW